MRAFLAAALVAALTALVPSTASAVSPDVVVSQVYGGGGNGGATLRQDYIELFNRGSSPVDLTGWSVRYENASGSFTASTPLTGSIPAGGYYLVRQAAGTGGTQDTPAPDATGTIAMSATAGQVRVVTDTADVRDLVGYGAGAASSEGGPAPAPSNTQAIIRGGNGCTDTDANSSDFTAVSPAPRNSSTTAAPCGPPPADQPVVANCGSGVVAGLGTGGSGGVSAADADGRVTDLALSNAPSGVSIGATTPAAAAGDTATATVTVSPATAPGIYTATLTATNDDATPQSGTCDLTITVPRTIGSVQGAVGDTASGAGHRSPFAPASGGGAGRTVAVQGVVTQRTLQRTASGGSQHGFVLQSTAPTSDGDTQSSDGIFVFTGSSAAFGGYTPTVGDELVLRGAATEFFNLTQLSSPAALRTVATAQQGAIAPFPADPPDSLADAERYWERREGARASVPANSRVLNGRNVFPSTADGEVWVTRPEHPIQQRSEPFARRSFRDPHPLDNNVNQLFDDGNGYRILLASLGIKGATGDNTRLIAPANTYDRIDNALTGAVYYGFNKYQVQVEEQPQLTPGPDPAGNAPPAAPSRPSEYSVADYNVENLYDFRDDPNDGCDFTGNAGCTGVNPPFDYVPASDAEYQARLGLIAQQIRQDLHSPELLLVQEAEDQDICSVSGSSLNCGTANNADGRPDTLQELALRISAQGGPTYVPVYDRDGADARGIVSAILYRSDRVELASAAGDDPVLGSSPQVGYRGTALAYNSQVSNPKALNAAIPGDVPATTGRDGSNVYTRAPQVGRFRVWREGVGQGTPIEVAAVSNHFSSTPNARMEQRREQAAYNAAIVNALRASRTPARVVTGGDFNVYPRPDDVSTAENAAGPRDQLGPLYESGLRNLYDDLLNEVPQAAYSYVFQGQTQTLDGLFVSPTLRGELRQVRSAHVNADYAADFPGDGARGLSDHDPNVARFGFPELGPNGPDRPGPGPGPGSGSTPGGGAPTGGGTTTGGGATGGGATDQPPAAGPPPAAPPLLPGPPPSGFAGVDEDLFQASRPRLRRGRVELRLTNRYPFTVVAQVRAAISRGGAAARPQPKRITLRAGATRRVRLAVKGKVPRGATVRASVRLTDPAGATRAG